MPIRTPARRLTATPTPLAGNATPVGFFMQKEGQTPAFQDTQPKGNLPFLKPEDAQYFDKLLVSDRGGVWWCRGWRCWETWWMWYNYCSDV